MNNMRKFAVMLMVLLIMVPSAFAVLKERDLSRTLAVLKKELESDALKQEQFMIRYQSQHKEQHQQLVSYMKQCEQIGLMLYSQKTEFTFDVAFACQQATDLYKALNSTNLPYDRIKERIMMDIERYDSLISMLEALPPSINNKEEMFALDSAIIDSIALSDSIIIDSLGADSSVIREALGPSAAFTPQKVAESKIGKKDSLITNEPFSLSEEEQKDRGLCVMYARKLRDNLLVFLELLKKDTHYYENVSQQVVKLNDYALSRYDYLQQSIFKNAGKNYFAVLMNLPRYWKQMTRDFTAKYQPLEGERSEWRGPIIIMVSIFMLVYIGIAVLLSNLIMRLIPWFMRKFFPKTAEKFELKVTSRIIDVKEMEYKKLPIMVALGIAIFGFAITVIRGFLWSNLFIMAAGLMITVAWLMEVVFVSLIIRLEGKQIKAGLRIYLPFLVMAFIVILFRIALVPNSLINLFYPPILLIVTLWQMRSCAKYKNKLPLSDSAYASISLGAMVIACVSAWIGYTLFAVQIIMWWMFQLAAIQTITCIYDLLMMYENKYIVRRLMRAAKKQTVDQVMDHSKDMTQKNFNKALAKAKTDTAEIIRDMKDGHYFTKTWLYDFLYKALLPIVGVLSILFSIYWAADIFQMSSSVTKVFFFNFIDKAGVLQLSLFKLCLVVAVFFLFRYINYALRSYYYHWYRKAKKDTENMNDTLVKNVIAILVWGGYFIFSLILLQVPKGGISLVTAGLATGMGFAMKDLLENFFYGISLMTGRVRVGDFIECDGIQGKVESITYQSTQITTLDGSVMAFLNSALFSKNFKNLTRNNSYLMVKIPVGVAYGEDVEKVRNVIVEAIKPLCRKTSDGRDLVHPKKDIIVAFSDFGPSSVDLLVCVWMLVEKKILFTAQLKEAIYDALKKHDIEIPFPQTDVHIKTNVLPDINSVMEQEAGKKKKRRENKKVE